MPTSKFIFIFLLILVLVGGCKKHQKVSQMQASIDSLSEQVERLKEENREAFVVKKTSEQMEALAYSQQSISETQRDEAIKQRQYAEEMKELALKEKEISESAQRDLEVAFQDLEESKKEAEGNKAKSDTFAMISLGQSLIMRAKQEWQTGDKDLAKLLFLAGWEYFYIRNGGENKTNKIEEVFYSILTDISELNISLSGHKGAVRSLSVIQSNPNKSSFVSVDEGGEILLWKFDGREFSSRLMYSNKSVNIRNVYYWKERGWIVASENQTGTFIIFYGEDFSKTYSYSENLSITNMLVVGQRIYFTSKENELYYREIPCEEELTTLSQKINAPTLLYKHFVPITKLYYGSYSHSVYLGDKQGRICAIDLAKGKFTSLPPFSKIASPITSMWESSKFGNFFIGFENGKIVWKSKDNSQVIEVHSSTITGFERITSGVISASNDRNVYLWEDEKTDNPIKLYNATGWIHCVCFLSAPQIILCGLSTGKIDILNFDLSVMLEHIRASLQREFTQEEWATYIGKDFPYKTFRNRKKK